MCIVAAALQLDMSLVQHWAHGMGLRRRQRVVNEKNEVSFHGAQTCERDSVVYDIASWRSY